jgi:hypothetical protein
LLIKDNFVGKCRSSSFNRKVNFLDTAARHSL